MKLPSTGQDSTGEDGNYRPKTLEIRKLLRSEDFKSGKLTKYHMWRHMGYKQETVKYHYYKIYFPKRFKEKYLSTGKTTN